MSVMSVSQRPGATELEDKIRGGGGGGGGGRPGRQPGSHDARGNESYTRSRLEREMRSRGPLARELRAHATLTRELRPLEMQPRELRPRGSVAGIPRQGELRRPGTPRARALAPGRRGRGVRLTRRGRLVVAAFVAGVILSAVAALWLAAATGAQASNHGAAPGAVYKGMTPVVVRPGQTLWAIALRAEPTADPRLVISQIVEFNALSSDVVVPGERLWVPKS